jgi:hypothetical protein
MSFGQWRLEEAKTYSLCAAEFDVTLKVLSFLTDVVYLSLFLVLPFSCSCCQTHLVELRMEPETGL